jgi:hypothetical protein
VARLAPGTWAGSTAAAGAPLEVGDAGQLAVSAGEVWLRRIDL